MTAVLTLGEAIGVLHSTESLAHAASLRVSTGGSEANVAIGLARLGVEVAWLGNVGDDGLGRRIVRELRAEGVRCLVRVDVDAPTGLLLKESSPGGRTEVTYHRRGSAGSRIVPADLAPVDWSDVGLLHITGITPALSAGAAATVDAAISEAQWRGIPVSFDVNHRSRLWGAVEATETYRSLATRATIVIAGLDEALMLAPEASDVEAAVKAITDLGPSEVVVTLGADGAIGSIDGQPHRVPAVPVQVVDTVGAGDAFVAGYLAERTLGRSAGTRMATAARAGAAACTHPGDWEGLPYRRDLEREDGIDPVTR